jgi:hypothetical protein
MLSNSVIVMNTANIMSLLVDEPSSAAEIATPELIPSTIKLNKTAVTTNMVSVRLL